MRSFIGTALIALCALVQTRPAAACGSCTCDVEPRSIINLVRNVPLNLEIPLRVLEAGEAAPWIERASDDMKVPATVEKRDAGTWWLAVDEELEPNTDYRIVRDSGVDSAFTTGNAPDHDAPVLEAISAQAGGNAALCGPSIGGVLTPRGARDGESFDVWLELHVVVGSTRRVIYTDYSRSGQTLPIGSSEGGCFGPLELPRTTAPAGYAIGARLYDAAGNASELVTTAFNAEASEPGGCGTPDGTAGSSAMEPTAGAGTEGGAGSPTSPAPTNAGTGADPTESERTSSGCGCAVPTNPGGASAAAWGVLLTLGLVSRRRRSQRQL